MGPIARRFAAHTYGQWLQQHALPHIGIQSLIYLAAEIDCPIKNVMAKYFPLYKRNDNINNEKSFLLIYWNDLERIYPEFKEKRLY